MAFFNIKADHFVQFENGNKPFTSDRATKLRQEYERVLMLARRHPQVNLRDGLIEYTKNIYIMAVYHMYGEDAGIYKGPPCGKPELAMKYINGTVDRFTADSIIRGNMMGNRTVWRHEREMAMFRLNGIPVAGMENILRRMVMHRASGHNVAKALGRYIKTAREIYDEHNVLAEKVTELHSEYFSHDYRNPDQEAAYRRWERADSELKLESEPRQRRMRKVLEDVCHTINDEFQGDPHTVNACRVMLGLTGPFSGTPHVEFLSRWMILTPKPHVCDSCGHLHLTDSGGTVWGNDVSETWCDDCLNEYASYNDEIGEWYKDGADVMRYYSDGNIPDRGEGYDDVPASWARQNCAIYFNSYLGQYVALDDRSQIAQDNYDEENREQDEPDEDEGPILEYHASKQYLTKIPSKWDGTKENIRLGLELEMECPEDESPDDYARDVLNVLEYVDGQRYMCLENDGSLENGFEMVTGWTGLDTHEKALQGLKRAPSDLSSHDTTTCGLHIHVTKADMSLIHAVKLVKFMNMKDNQLFLDRIARRGNQGYCQRGEHFMTPGSGANPMVAIRNRKDTYAELFRKVKSTPRTRESQRVDMLQYINGYDRYQAINFCNQKTVEFRLFKGSMKYETVMASLEFAYLAYKFTRDASFSMLTWKDFIEYVYLPVNSKNSRYLRAYMRVRKIKHYLIKREEIMIQTRATNKEIKFWKGFTGPLPFDICDVSSLDNETRARYNGYFLHNAVGRQILAKLDPEFFELQQAA